ncbi:type II secretion system protein GspM [Candidatus Aalborgicola defluviihabitans]|jgi:general secretion pathway protein M|uniref:type II secretion system protein GspM n=1 Tax=Candidatus Aalborgicola defluviihabitans TaxID=3386187 RepID=UPI001DE5AAB6|nr:type II secretion system protein M [Burkholderiales bacterium]MBK6570797.1 type II secretion system protein M [Burkholderiales bacterium]MBK7279792.1 type II secretion system protein M [Burkholderiales bacterium]MBL0243331.1 type II secretion system protein M [Rhodoferax sp.]
MKQLNPLQSKLAALAILLLILALVVCAIAVPIWLLNRRYDLAVDDAANRLQRYSKIVGMRDGLQKKTIEIKALESARHFLKSASPALAAAELQELVKAILDENGGKLTSIQILPHKDDGQYRQVSVVLQFNAPLSAVKAMLHALESAHPYLFVDNLQMRVANPLVQAKDVLNEPEMFVQFDLTGYTLKGAQ